MDGSRLTLALKIAIDAHGRQVDKAKEPYLGHVLRVAFAAQTENERLVALLHDVVEDSRYTLDDLAPFGKEIVAAVDALTKREGESYEVYLRRVKANPLACNVKLLDITDNLTPGRLPESFPNRAAMRAKYESARDYLYRKRTRGEWQDVQAEIARIKS